MSEEKLELKYVPLDTVVLWDRNPKKHDYGAIVESIKKYGFKDPPKFEPKLNDGKGGIVEGNGRSVALKDMFMNDEPIPRGIVKNGKGWLVPVLFGVDADSKATAEAYALDHNSITLLGGDFGMYDLAKLYDEKVYADLLKDLQDADLPPVSMDYDDIGAFLNTVQNGNGALASDDDHAGELIDKAEELQKKWKVVNGDIWQIGEHFILCGDCTNFDDWQKLLNAADVKKVNGVFTSPPYAEQRKKQYGGIPTEKYVEWWYDVQANVRAHLAEDGSFFVNIKPHCENGERVLYVFDLVLAMRRKWEWRFVDELCWIRNSMPNGTDYRFRNGFEPLYHFSISENPKARIESVRRDAAYKKPSRVKSLNKNGSGLGTFVWSPEDGALPDNVLYINTGEVNIGTKSHQGTFPASLPGFFIKAYSDKGDIWLDNFLGSGTTICAAHRNGRRGLGIEKLEKYVAVCLERITKETNEEPKRMS